MLCRPARQSTNLVFLCWDTVKAVVVPFILRVSTTSKSLISRSGLATDTDRLHRRESAILDCVSSLSRSLSSRSSGGVTGRSATTSTQLSELARNYCYETEIVRVTRSKCLSAGVDQTTSWSRIADCWCGRYMWNTVHSATHNFLQYQQPSTFAIHAQCVCVGGGCTQNTRFFTLVTLKCLTGSTPSWLYELPVNFFHCTVCTCFVGFSQPTLPATILIFAIII